jgi:hypothetical protein
MRSSAAIADAAIAGRWRRSGQHHRRALAGVIDPDTPIALPVWRRLEPARWLDRSAGLIRRRIRRDPGHAAGRYHIIALMLACRAEASRASDRARPARLLAAAFGCSPALSCTRIGRLGSQAQTTCSTSETFCETLLGGLPASDSWISSDSQARSCARGSPPSPAAAACL